MAQVILSENGKIQFETNLRFLTEEDKIALRFWITFMEKYGIEASQKNTSFRDHPLTGEWNGFRAASFGYSARVIYRIVDSFIEIVEIERITTSHDYKR